MAFQPVPNTAAFRLVHTYQSGLVQIINTIYVRNSLSGWSALQLSNHATAIGNAWRDNVVPQLASGALFDKVEARDIGSEFGNQAVVEYNTNGGDTGTGLTGALAMLVKLSGSPGSAPRQGRLFLGPFTEGDVTGDTWDSTVMTAIATALGAVDTAIAAFTGSAWVIVSRYLNNALRASGVTNTISTRTVRNIVATQRDRRIGEGA